MFLVLKAIVTNPARDEGEGLGVGCPGFSRIFPRVGAVDGSLSDLRSVEEAAALRFGEDAH